MKSFQWWFLTRVHSFPKGLFILLLAALFFGCKEDEDEESPKVFMEMPIENQLVMSVDTFEVRARISDNNQVSYVEIDLLDQNFATVISKQRFPVSGSDFTFSTDFMLDAPFIDPGPYYLNVRAFDGRNIGSGFRQISVAVAPRTLDQIIVITSSNFSARVLTRSDNLLWQERFQLQIDYAGAALNFRQNLLCMAGGTIGDAVFYETGDFEIQSTVPGLGAPSFPYFAGVEFDSETQEFLLLQNEPRLRTFDKNGFGITGFPLQENHRPYDVFDVANYYFVVEKPITNPNYILSKYARPGLLLSALATDGHVLGVFEKSDNELFIWVAANNQVQLKILNLNSNLLSSPYERNGEILYDVVQVAPNTFVFSTSQGLYRYSYSNGGTLVLDAGFTAEKLFFESLSETIYGISGQQLHRITTMGEFISTEDFAQPVKWIGFDYNR